MSNFEYVVSSGVWELVYDPSVSGDFTGYAQVVNGSSVGIYIGTSLPASTVVGALVGANPSKISVTTSSGEKIYARRLGNAAQLSLIADAVGNQDGPVLTASVSSAAVLFTVDMTSWNSVLLQVTSAGTSCTVTYETSNDQITWNPTNILSSNAVTTGSPLNNSSSAALQYQIAKRGMYLRARVSVYGSGTVSVAYSLSTSSVTPALGACIWGTTGEGGAIGGTNPVVTGIEARTTRKTAVANAQVVRPIGTVDGRLIVRQHSIPENEWKYAAAAGGSLTNSTTAATLAAAGGAGLSVYLTSLQIQSGAITNVTDLVVYDGTSGVVIWRCSIPTTGMPLTTITFADPLKGTANTLMGVFTVTAIGTGSIYVNAQGYYAP